MDEYYDFLNNLDEKLFIENAYAYEIYYPESYKNWQLVWPSIFKFSQTFQVQPVKVSSKKTDITSWEKMIETEMELLDDKSLPFNKQFLLAEVFPVKVQLGKINEIDGKYQIFKPKIKIVGTFDKLKKIISTLYNTPIKIIKSSFKQVNFKKYPNFHTNKSYFFLSFGLMDPIAWSQSYLEYLTTFKFFNLLVQPIQQLALITPTLPTDFPVYTRLTSENIPTTFEPIP